MNEQELFNLIKKELIEDLIHTEDKFDPTDCWSPTYNLAIELKCRNTDYPTLLIEKFKYDKLQEYDNNRYICSTPKGVWSFDLKKIKEPEWVEQEIRRSTFFGSKFDKIIKIVGYLDKKDGKKLDL